MPELKTGGTKEQSTLQSKDPSVASNTSKLDAMLGVLSKAKADWDGSAASWSSRTGMLLQALTCQVKLIANVPMRRRIKLQYCSPGFLWIGQGFHRHCKFEESTVVIKS